jgi:hypothetical protein
LFLLLSRLHQAIDHEIKKTLPFAENVVLACVLITHRIQEINPNDCILQVNLVKKVPPDCLDVQDWTDNRVQKEIAVCPAKMDCQDCEVKILQHHSSCSLSVYFVC